MPPPSRPTDLPDALWLFDGVCNVCSGSVRLILKLDRNRTIHFTPIQSAFGRMLARSHGIDPDMPQSFIFVDRGEAITRSDAVAALLARLETPWRWLAPVVRGCPKPWRDRVYDWIAANRYRIAGRRKACMAPGPDLRARFIVDPPA